MVQYALLAWSHVYPSLSDWTDNVRQLESLADSGLVSNRAADDLREAYLAYRSATHERALQELPGKVDVAQWASLREKVSARWRDWFDDNFGE
jgi:glutamate-ammonia-ligase adenylyltransferase